MSLLEYFEPGRLFRITLVVTLGIMMVYVEASPLGIGPDAPPSPDLLLCIVVFWSVRRPEAVPMVMVFALGLVRDMLTDVPIGAGALSLVLVAEVFKANRRYFARTSFLREWMALAFAAAAGSMFVWTLVLLTFAQPPFVSDLLHQCLYTAMIYPLFIFVLRWILRIGWSRVEMAG